MDLRDAWAGFFLFCSFWFVTFCTQDGFLSLYISWISDTTYITTGKTTTITYSNRSSSSNISARFFLNSRRCECYRIPVKNAATLVLVRAKFVYKNYDGLEKHPTFSVSIGTAIAATINLAKHDPWSEEFLWTVNKDTLSFCLIAIPNGGSPVISSLEIRPLPRGAYKNGLEDFPNKLLRKSIELIVDSAMILPDRSFTTFHVVTGFKIQLSFNQSSLVEEPPAAVLQTGRVLARRKAMTYDLPLEAFGDCYIILYFAGILPVYPSFDVFINGDIVKSNYTIRT